jgi:hypothetical protein
MRTIFCAVMMLFSRSVAACGRPAHVESLDRRGERHCEIDVAARYVEIEAAGHQRHPDQKQERQRQHLGGGVVGDEPRHRPRRRIHDGDRDQHRGDHDADIPHHADGGDDGIDGEHEIDGDELGDDEAHRSRCRRRGLFRRRVLIGDVDLRMHLVGRLGDEEETPRDQDQVVPGKWIAPHREHGGGQAQQRRKREQEGNTENQRQAKADAPGGFGTAGVETAHQDRNEDDVVDAEHDLEGSQARECRPRIEIGQEVEHESLTVWSGNIRRRQHKRRSGTRRR